MPGSPPACRFICWPRPKAAAGSSYIFTVWFKGQATHHTANLTDGVWTVNKKPCTGASSIEDVKKYLEAKRILDLGLILGHVAP